MRLWPRLAFFGVVALVFAPAARAAERLPDFQVGGPLAGLQLPKLGLYEVEHYPGAVERYALTVGGMDSHLSLFDQQSQLKNWTAPNIPGSEGLRSEQFLAKRPKPGHPRSNLGEVGVVRCKVLAPVFKLDLGELSHGLYVVRVIAAGEIAKQKSPYEPLYLAMKVNDGLAGEVSQYRQCCNVTDDFYSIAEFYIHAPEKRRYQAELWVDEGSTVEPLVHNITLDDALAGTQRRAIKTRSVLTTPEERAKLFNPIKQTMEAPKMKFTPAERLARDEAIWNWLPPVNAQGSVNFMAVFNPNAVIGTGQSGDTSAGNWETTNFAELDSNAGFVLRRDGDLGETLLVNKKLNLKYTMRDLRAGKPLPGPNADRGNGIYKPNPQDATKFYAFAPIARAVGMRNRSGYCMAEGLGGQGAAKMWSITRNPEFARDAAVNLVRFAYQFPTLDFALYLDNVTAPRDRRFLARETRAMWADHYANYAHPLEHYDYLFDYIQGNEELAQSIHRFVPWVKSSKDVIELVDVYLVQQTAKRILRYHYYTMKTGIVTPSLVLADRKVTDPWMEWLFDRVLPYGLPVMGVQDTVIGAYDRSGMHYIGSFSYAEHAAGEVMRVREYARLVDSPQFDLTDPARYPKALASCYFPFRTRLAGLDFPRIGDVAGPDKLPVSYLIRCQDAARWGWQIQPDPQFAWTLQHYAGQENQTDAEWAKITAAAAGVKRAPWLDNRSRTIDNWFTALETGHEHDDHRFRRAAYLRIGQGTGHEHQDALDLQIVSHGVPMTIDGGQRSGYSKPNDRHYARNHNVVEVDGRGHHGHSWAQSLTDAQGARYMKVNATPPTGARLYTRQLALVDVHEGQGSKPLSPAEQVFKTKLPTGIAPAASYVFDVFRVAGGSSHAYCFHAMVDDEFHWNATGEKPVPHIPADGQNLASDEGYLSLFELSDNFAATAPDALQATWRYSRDPKFTGTEPFMLGQNYDVSAPRKFLRLHLNGASGMKAYRGETQCYHEGIPYKFTCSMTRRTGTDLETVFPAIIEPYADQPAIVSQKLLPIIGNEVDALRAVAVEVKLPGGRTDVCFADGRPDKERTVGQHKLAGEFALVSSDATGLRQAALSGGTRLTTPDLQLIAAERERTAKVTAVDYAQRKLTLSADWSAFTGAAIEVGSPGHMTGLSVVSVAPANNVSAVTVLDAPDYLRISVEPGGKPNLLTLRAMPVLKKIEGYDREWVISNDDATRFWRAEHVQNNQLQVAGTSFSLGDLGPKHLLRMWEYGTGDTARHTTHVSLRRVEAGVYECSGDVDVTVMLRSSAISVSRDQATWKPVKTAAPAAGWSQVMLPGVQLAKGVIFISTKAQ